VAPLLGHTSAAYTHCTVHLEYQLPEPNTIHIQAYLNVPIGVILSNNNYIQKHVFRKTHNILPWTVDNIKNKRSVDNIKNKPYKNTDTNTVRGKVLRTFRFLNSKQAKREIRLLIFDVS
jgi:hypothetical protein